MKLIYKHFRFLLLTVLALTGIIVLTGQSSNAQKLQWQGLSGTNNEFLFLIPEGYQVSDDGEFNIGGDKDSVIRIKDRRAVSRYVNGVVLMVDLYQGKTQDIQTLLATTFKSELVKEETVNGFQFKSYLKKNSEFVLEQQHFFNKNTLYVMTAAYRTERGAIIDNFFKAVRLVNQGKTAAPNFPKDAKKELLNAGLPYIVEETYSNEIVEQPEKKAVVLYRPKPSFNREFGKMNSGKVKLNILFLNSGTVKKVELLSSPNVTLFEGVRKSAEHLVFLPAEKNGKPVTAWQVVDYGFQMTLTGY